MNRRERREALEAVNRGVARTKLILKRLEERVAAPPASNSFYWRPKGEKPQEDAPWLKDGWSGKR